MKYSFAIVFLREEIAEPLMPDGIDLYHLNPLRASGVAGAPAQEPRQERRVLGAEAQEVGERDGVMRRFRGPARILRLRRLLGAQQPLRIAPVAPSRTPHSVLPSVQS